MARPRARHNRDLPDNLYRRPDGRLYYRDPRTGRTFTLGRDEAAARAQATEVNLQIAELEARVRLTHTIAGGADRTVRAWLAEYGKTLTVEAGYSKRTVYQYRSNNNRLTELLGDYVIHEMRGRHITAALKPLIDAGQTKGAHGLLKHLQRACNAAIAEGWLEPGQNPAEALRIRKGGVTRQRLSLDDFRAVYAAAERREPWVRRWLELSILTALRVSDVLSLRWRHAAGASGWVDGDVLRVITRKTGSPIALPLALSCPGAGPWTIGSALSSVRSDGVVAPTVLRRTVARGRARVGGVITVGIADQTFRELITEAKIKVADGLTPPTPHELRSLSLRLYRSAYGRDWARLLGTHASEQMADLYADPRGIEWTTIEVPAAPLGPTGTDDDDGDDGD